MIYDDFLVFSANEYIRTINHVEHIVWLIMQLARSNKWMVKVNAPECKIDEASILMMETPSRGYGKKIGGAYSPQPVERRIAVPTYLKEICFGDLGSRVPHKMG